LFLQNINSLNNIDYLFLLLSSNHFNFVFKQDEGKFAATFIDIKVQGACFNG